MSWSSGTGSPVHFMCSACRRSRGAGRGHEGPVPGRAERVRLNGRRRQRDCATARHGRTLREYECLDCGHVGWSAHQDLKVWATRPTPQAFSAREQLARALVGKAIARVTFREVQLERDAWDPTVVFTDGSRLRFNVAETDVGEYGVDLILVPPR